MAEILRNFCNVRLSCPGRDAGADGFSWQGGGGRSQVACRGQDVGSGRCLVMAATAWRAGLLASPDPGSTAVTSVTAGLEDFSGWEDFYRP